METEREIPIVNPGDVLAGKYRVERVLGAGGMGVVVAALHMQLGQRVALKFLHAAGSKDPAAVARFLREARAVVQIQSEHVARVSDVGTLENGAPYIVMEFLSGTDLEGLLEKRGPLPVDEAIEYLLQACVAIADAHKLGIIHRDLKPANLFLCTRSDGSPLVKVLDFGISKIESESASALTATASLFGSPLYMSPEQMRSAKKVDLRTDIWALGIILHELLTATRAFDADTLPGLCTQIAMEPPTRLREKRADAPQDVEAAILRCLEKDPARRFANVAELADALAPYGRTGAWALADRARMILGVGPRGESAAPPLLGAAPPAPASTGNLSRSEPGLSQGWGGTAGTLQTASPRSRAIALSAAVLVLGVVVAAIGITFAVRSSRAPATSTASSTSASAVAAPSPPPREVALPADPAPPSSAAVNPAPAPAPVPLPAPLPGSDPQTTRPAPTAARVAPSKPRAVASPPASPIPPTPSAKPQGTTPRDGYSDRK